MGKTQLQTRSVVVFGLLVVLLGCGDSRMAGEGAMPAECADGADNDADGAVDCADSGCMRAPACDGNVDAGPPGPFTFPERDYVCPVGASSPCETTQNAHSTAELTALVPSGPPRTYVYVVTALRSPAADAGRVAGFNLDALDTTSVSTGSPPSCAYAQPDRAPLFDLAQVGVDNMFETVVPTLEYVFTPEDCPGGITTGCYNALWQQQITSGATLLLIAVTDVNDLAYDPSVQVQLYAGTVPGGGAPALGADGSLVAGQSFAVTPLGTAHLGDIFAGRVRVLVDALPLPFFFASSVFTLTVHGVELRFDITPDRLARGALGGSLRSEEIVSAVATHAPDYTDEVRVIAADVADLSPSGTDLQSCTGVSLGLAFEATAAIVAP